jgi:hypothetical protein
VDIRGLEGWISAGYLERIYMDSLLDINVEISVDIFGYNWIY